MERMHLPCGSSTRPILYCRSWTGRRRKRTKKRTANNFLHSSWPFQQRRQRSRISYRYQETEKSAWSNSLETRTRGSVLGALTLSTKCWFGIWADIFQRHCYVPVRAEGMRRKRCQRKRETRIVRQTTHASRRTKSNTQRKFGFKEDLTFRASLGKPG